MTYCISYPVSALGLLSYTLFPTITEVEKSLPGSRFPTSMIMGGRVINQENFDVFMLDVWIHN